jgi:hypothetical protein
MEQLKYPYLQSRIAAQMPVLKTGINTCYTTPSGIYTCSGWAQQHEITVAVSLFFSFGETNSRNSTELRLRRTLRQKELYLAMKTQRKTSVSFHQPIRRYTPAAKNNQLSLGGRKIDLHQVLTSTKQFQINIGAGQPEFYWPAFANTCSLVAILAALTE